MFKDYIKYDGKLLTSPCMTPTDIEGDCLSFNAVKPFAELQEGEYYIRVKNFSWHNTSLNNPSTAIPYQHDPIRGANTRVDRTISIKGIIVAADREGREKGVITNNALYRLENDLSFHNKGFFKLEWGGENDTDFWCYAQVSGAKPQVQIEEGRHIITEFEVDLIIRDGLIFAGSETMTFNVEEGYIGGEDIGTTLWGQPMADVFNPSPIGVDNIYMNSCFNDNQIPLKVTITATGVVNPMTEAPNVGYVDKGYVGKDIIFGNVNTGVGIKLNHQFSPTDVIVLDGYTNNVYLNGVEANGMIDLEVNSIPTINSSEDAFILHDSTFFGAHGKQLVAEVEFNPVI